MKGRHIHAWNFSIGVGIHGFRVLCRRRADQYEEMQGKSICQNLSGSFDVRFIHQKYWSKLRWRREKALYHVGLPCDDRTKN